VEHIVGFCRIFELKILIDECFGAHFYFKALSNFKEIWRSPLHKEDNKYNEDSPVNSAVSFKQRQIYETYFFFNNHFLPSYQNWINHLERMDNTRLRNTSSTTNLQEEEIVDAQKTMTTRRCRNRSNELIHGGR